MVRTLEQLKDVASDLPLPERAEVADRAGLLLGVRTHRGSYAKVWVSIVQTPDFTLKMTTYQMGSAAG